MDKIKFDFAYCPTYGSIYTIISVNGQDLAKQITKEEHKLLSKGEIGFVRKYEGIQPNELLKGLLSNEGWFVILCHELDYYQAIRLN